MTLKPFKNRVYLSSPTIHGEELRYITEAFETNFVSTLGENIDTVERLATEKLGCKYAVALTTGTAAIHLCVKLAGVHRGDTVFVSDPTFVASANPVIYEGAIPVFVDCEPDTWNLSPEALERAFSLYPDTRVVICTNLYGTPAKLEEIAAITARHGAVLIEDAAESFGASYRGRQTGTFGAYNTVSFNGNKIITGSAGGLLLTDDREAASLARKWSQQSREEAPWYQHEEIGYNYRMSNIIAGAIRGQFPYLEEHIAQKKAIYMRYKEGFRNLPVSMNPYIEGDMAPNYWLSCLLIDEDAMCEQIRDDHVPRFIKQQGKTCPTEILEALEHYNAEGRPIWKPIHEQPLYRDHAFVSVAENCDVGADIFRRGLCLPSDNKMTPAEQDTVIEIVKTCFKR